MEIAKFEWAEWNNFYRLNQDGEKGKEYNSLTRIKKDIGKPITIISTDVGYFGGWSKVNGFIEDVEGTTIIINNPADFADQMKAIHDNMKDEKE